MIVILIRFRDDRESKLSFKLWNFQLILFAALSTTDSRAFYLNGQPNEWVTNEFFCKQSDFDHFQRCFSMWVINLFNMQSNGFTGIIAKMQNIVLSLKFEDLN